MDNQAYNQIVSFIWGIADDCLRDVYTRGKYRDVILPMTVLRRLDAVLEDTKPAVREMKKQLEAEGVVDQYPHLCRAAKQVFYNDSEFKLRDLLARPAASLQYDFGTYLKGFTENVKEILDKFKFHHQIDTMVEAGILRPVIEKFVSPDINLSPDPVRDAKGRVLPGLDNHTMGTIFEELIRRFNEENNEEAGEHFTPRDVVELMADLVFVPIADQIKDATYTCYDGACGTGGMLTVAERRLTELARQMNRRVNIQLYGQEINPETYAIAKADLMLKGNGDQAGHIVYGSTLSADGFPNYEFDFILSNPPYGKSWKVDTERMGGKNKISDPRFVTEHKGEEFPMVSRTSDGQLMFLLNSAAKMQRKTKMGTRVAQVHNGSSLFTGDAGQGESNARRYMIEQDYVDAVIALPEKMFYNTGIGTYIWLLSSRKQERRQGRIQLIDATSFRVPLRKNLGEKNCEFDQALRKRILDLYMNFEENAHSKIFFNEDFGYWRITIERPMRHKFICGPTEAVEQLEVRFAARGKTRPELLHQLPQLQRQLSDRFGVFSTRKECLQHLAPILDRFTLSRGELRFLLYEVLAVRDPEGEVFLGKDKRPVADRELTTTEQVPYTYPGGIQAYFESEILPYAPDAWLNEEKTQVGYELNFTRHFYRPAPLRSLEEITADLRALDQEMSGMLDHIIGGVDHASAV